MSNNEQFSSNVKAANKSVTENKQVNSIRKITVESLSPIIHKLEQHISYLMEQTKILRNDRQILEVATSNHKQLEKQITIINNQLAEHSKRINDNNSDKEKKIKNQAEQIKQLQQEVVKLKEDSISKKSQISQIKQNNEKYLSQININKESIQASIKQLRQSLQKYYENQLMQIDSIRLDNQMIHQKIYSAEAKIVSTQESLLQVSKITSLYEVERIELKQKIDRAVDLEYKMVFKDAYQQDKKYQKIQNQMLKKKIQEMLDEALTPEIRKFLPVLIQKMGQLDSFSKKLSNLYTTIQQVKLESSQQIEKVYQKIQQRDNHNNQRLKELSEVINQEIYKKIAQNQQKNNQNIRLIYEKFNQVEEKEKIQKSELQKYIDRVADQAASNLELQIAHLSQNLINSKKQQIYNIVLQLTPKQKKEQYQNVTKIVFSVTPLIEKVEADIYAVNKLMNNNNQTIKEKLDIFSRQMVKTKSDMKMQTIENKKNIQQFQQKLDVNNKASYELSRLASKTIELAMISLSISIDESFLQRQNEVYVANSDGIVLEVKNFPNDQLTYRKKILNKEVLKRAVMTELIKLIDDEVSNHPQINWTQKQNRPSHFFHEILNSYLSISEQNKHTINMKMNPPPKTSRNIGQLKQVSKNLSIPKKNNANLSKTIDFTKDSYPSQYRQHEDIEEGPKKSIRLKKL